MILRGRRNLIAWILALVMLGLLTIVVYTYQAYRQAATDLIMSRDEQLVILAAARLRDELLNFGEDLDDIVRRDVTTSSNPKLTREARESQPRTDVFDAGITLLNDHGVVLATFPHRPEILGLNWSDRDYFRAMLNEDRLFISDIVEDGQEGTPVIVIAVPIFGEQNTFEGVLAGMLQLGESTTSAFYASIIRLRIGQSGDVYIADGDGRIIFDSNNDRVGNSLSTEELEIIQSADNTSIRLVEDDQGQKVVIATTPVPSTNWTLVVEEDWNFLTQSIRKYNYIFILSFIAALTLPPAFFYSLRKQSIIPSLRDATLTTNDLHLKQKLHNEFHPQRLPVLPGWSILYDHINNTSGRDFADIRVLLDGRLLVNLGEINRASSIYAIISSAIRSLVGYTVAQLKFPHEILQACNEMICSSFGETTTIRNIHLTLDPLEGLVQYAHADFPPVFLFGDEVAVEPFDYDQIMGLNPDVSYKTVSQQIGKGEGILIISPSMLQHPNFVGQTFLSHRLPSILDLPFSTPEELFGVLREGIKTFLRNLKDDRMDVMILFIYRLPSQV